MQTGGVGGKRVAKPPAASTVGGAAAKMKLAVSLQDGMRMRPPFRHLLSNYAAEETHRHGEALTVLEGTEIQEVSRARLMAERRVLEGCDLHDAEGARKAMERLNKKLAKEAKKQRAEKKC